ncbi:MAG: complex I NDUFA9 subunit family protein [Rhodospirillaceae bacterium]
MDLKSVTVFGGSGFVGRYIVRELAKTGARVRVAVRNVERAQFLKPMGDVGQVVPLLANVRDDASVAAAVDGADAVINLVGILYEGGRQTFQAVQAEAPGRIARAAAATGARRFIQVSAIGADPESESAYGRSKAAGEAAARAAFPGTTVLRPSIVFGPEDDFFNRFAAMARLAPVLPLVNGGETRFQPVYVGDVADAALAALRDPKSAGRTYELGGPGIYTFRALMELMLREIGRKRVLLPVPEIALWAPAMAAELLPAPPLTRDQLIQLRRDNVVAPGAAGLPELGIQPTALEVILPTYLPRYRRGGATARLGTTG